MARESLLFPILYKPDSSRRIKPSSLFTLFRSNPAMLFSQPVTSRLLQSHFKVTSNILQFTLKYATCTVFLNIQNTMKLDICRYFYRMIPYNKRAAAPSLNSSALSLILRNNFYSCAIILTLASAFFTGGREITISVITASARI